MFPKVGGGGKTNGRPDNTLIDRYFVGEPGLSYLIETKDAKILFDVGYSDVFLSKRLINRPLLNSNGR